MDTSTVTAVHRLNLRPTERQTEVLRVHAEYAARARRWAREHPDTSPKRAYQAFKASDRFNATLSGTVAERAIEGSHARDPGQRAALAARIDAIWNGIGVVVWAAGVSWKGCSGASRRSMRSGTQGSCGPSLGMPPRRHTEAPLGRAPQGTGVTIEPPRAVYVGSWRPLREGGERWLTVPGRDQGAASFVQMLRENAERLGVRVVGVDEEYTTMSDWRSVIRHA